MGKQEGLFDVIIVFKRIQGETAGSLDQLQSSFENTSTAVCKQVKSVNSYVFK